MGVRTSSLTVASWMPPDRLVPEKPIDFAQVFDAHASFVWRVLRRLGVPDADADDAAQEVFLVVHHKLAAYEERGSIRAWLFTISRQVASHRRRSCAAPGADEREPPRGPLPRESARSGDATRGRRARS